MITVLFFAHLREAFADILQDKPALTLAITDTMTVKALQQQLAKRYPETAIKLLEDSVLIAVNQEVIVEDVCLKAGDEVAFFPPVTGG